MLKWIASGCLVVIVVVGVVTYAGYRKMQSIASNGPSVTVAIRATPERVFASMSHTDSLASWFASGMTLRSPRKGALASGDTLFVSTRRDSVPRTAWVVDTVVPNRVVALRWVVLQNGVVLHRRRDSVSTAGDSTFVTTTITATMTDSLVAARRQSSGVSGGLLDMASTVGSAGARIQAETELNMLKRRIEGPPVSRP
jgi:uncharacterized protein YndB with AHSA1/START domain